MCCVAHGTFDTIIERHATDSLARLFMMKPTPGGGVLVRLSS